MELSITLPTLARHEYEINHATGNFALKVVDYTQKDILINFTLRREYNSRKGLWKFNINDNAQKITLKSLREIFFIYEGKNLVAVKDELGRVTRYEYEENLLQRVIYPDGSQVKYFYDYKKRLVACIERGKKIFQNEYDDLGRIITFSDDSGTRIFFYADKNRQTIEEGSENKVYCWNRRKLIEKIIYADSTEEIFIYDENNQLNYRRERDGTEYFWRYVNGRLALEVLPDGLIKSFKYDDRGNVTKEYDSEGKEKLFYYSAKNLLIGKETRLNLKDWRRESWERDVAGRILKYNINGQVTTYSYDDESPEPSIIETPCGYKFTCIYDKAYRLLTLITAEGEFSFAHTPMNEIIAEKKNIFEPLEIPETFLENAGIKIFDVGGRLIEIRQKVGEKFHLIRWKYDANDNCLERREWQDLQTAQSATGRVKTVKYSYDAQNRLIRKVDGDTITKYYYDCLNRLVRERKESLS